VVAFAVLASLMVAGRLARIDQYAVDHWMPQAEPSDGSSSTSIVHALLPTLGGPLQAFCNLWTFPASALLSAATLAVCCAVLVRRGQRRAALAWTVAWFAANVVEVVGKQVLHRPPLHAVEDGLRVSFDNFGHSFPSGHALRTVVTAALVVTVWRKAAIPVLAWAVVSVVALVVSADHTPSDVLGGVLLALAAVLCAVVWVRVREPSPAAAPE
jgi:membrane-associated phospholipid phosphatase